MRFNTTVGDFGAVMDGIVGDLDRAVTGAMDEITRGLKTDLRQQVAGAGLGARLANTWQGRRYPIGRTSADASAFVWSKAPKVIDAFDRGAVIRSSRGFYLAIPTAAAGTTGRTEGGRRQRVSPESWTRKTGIPLRFVYRPGRPSLLVADDARVGKTGLAKSALRRSKAGDSFVRVNGRVTVVVFILVPQVTLPRRLNIETVADRWASQVPDLIARHWND